MIACLGRSLIQAVIKQEPPKQQRERASDRGNVSHSHTYIKFVFPVPQRRTHTLAATTAAQQSTD